MNVVIMINSFKKHLTAIGYAESTVTAYQRYLGDFSNYLGQRRITDIRNVTRNVITDYQQTVMDMPLARESKAIKLRPVKRLFEYLEATHQLLVNPCEGLVEVCRKNKKIGPVLTPDELKKVLAQPDLSLPVGFRNRVIMEVLYATGIRLIELLTLELNHIDFDENLLSIKKGKGDKDRVVPMGKHAAKYVKEYIRGIRPLLLKKNPDLSIVFVTKNGNILQRPNVYGFLRDYRQKSGIEKRLSPHTFRRTCATHLLQQGADIRYIQQLLGHKHLVTTQVYTKVMPIELKQTHDRTHPGKRLGKSWDQTTETKR